jgi:excinuclease ABC subunit A
VLDEPTIGQHPADVARILPAFRNLAGPVVYVEHDRAAAAYADRAIDLGPGAGDEGGRIVFAGAPVDLWQSETITGRYFSLRDRVVAAAPRPKCKQFLKILGAKAHNLQALDISIPVGRLVVITGVSGSGKSTLVEDVLVPSLAKGKPVNCRAVVGPKLKAVVVDQSPIGHNPRSNPATYTKLSDIVRDLYARQTGLSPSHYSFNRPEGACPTCAGIGAVEVKMRYLPSTWIPCSDCDSQRFSDEVLSRKVELGGQRLSIADFYRLSIFQVRALLAEDSRLSAANRASVRSMLDALVTIGLGYVPMGQPSPSLSGGESQRVKLAKFLGKKKLVDRLIILDEPTTGLHPRDLKGLLEVLNTLVEAGASVVVVEHNLDIIRAADWVVDLGPGAGPMGGQVVYEGPPSGLMTKRASATGKALKEEESIHPRVEAGKGAEHSEYISIRNARANNLKGVDIDIPKGAFTVVTGVSGSGKSSLVHDVLEAEAKRRFLESLSLYERQGIHEGPEAPVESVSGLGVSVSITPGERLYSRRSTVGTVTEISHHLAVLLAMLGERTCLKCGAMMERSQEWVCPTCKETAPVLEARHFSSSTYYSACPMCNGIGTLQVPDPSKLIVNPDRAICGGAMYSPGFFPKGYLCKPYNHGYYYVQALGQRYGFDPEITPWNEISPVGQKAFLFGDSEPLSVTVESRTRPPTTKILPYRGFYGLIGDWDVGGTYTISKICTQCNGTGFRPEVLAVRLAGYDAHALGEMPLTRLSQVLGTLETVVPKSARFKANLKTILERLKFLISVGVGYLHLNRVSATLSAGEAQRVRIAGILGSGLTSLTILLDEPSRGMHPSEVDALANVLKELRHEGNTVVVVEHDPVLIKAADHIVEMGPGPGDDGGNVIAEGNIDDVGRTDTPTGRWLRGKFRIEIPRERREPRDWLVVKGARENNLREADVRVPLGLLVGVCGVSGSGKSTLIVDTIGRALAPRLITTSVAQEPMQPGAHDSIEGAPRRTIVLDQTREHIINPGQFLDVFGPLTSLYAESNDAKALGLSEEDLTRPCSACDGRGIIRTDMGFLPDAITPCETCQGTGRSKESWDVRVSGVAYPELARLTIDRAWELFGEIGAIGRRLQAARDVGLGYLVLHQPGQTLSGGECQRLKIAKELSRDVPSSTMYILDEPTVGLHVQDVGRLIQVLGKIVDGGDSVVVIEHHPHVLSACDWLIELGPGAGPDGGRVIASGTPESVEHSDTPTAPYLRDVLEAAR